jgi:hypothetical protein
MPRGRPRKLSPALQRDIDLEDARLVYLFIRAGCQTVSHIGLQLALRHSLVFSNKRIERALAYLFGHGYASYDAGNKLIAGPHPPQDGGFVPPAPSKDD